MDDQNSDTVVASEDELRGSYGEPMDIALMKQLRKLDAHCKDFISRSPFLCIGTSAADGKADVSPRGDPPGFVQVLDDNTIFIPDRPGNNRLDTMSNIVANPDVGLLFLIPGFEDALRVNGKAKLVKDKKILERCAVNRKVPTMGIMVEVDEAYLHCAKAVRRSKLWQAESQQDRKEMPTLAQMILEQVATPEKQPTKEEIKEGDEFVEENYKTGLY
ncbi:MAG: pyridoxamine 5'-phosphate oxidase family protein [Proteobacteria bacterium]|nr:pyridoxamine 5'-phosphate oxidase family protein [Pseudomonadota bacterium]MDA1355943.1 pyridoxamine 5'-phosphate oxidase family protein [Pseudomonadota bacterium]